MRHHPWQWTPQVSTPVLWPLLVGFAARHVHGSRDVDGFSRRVRHAVHAELTEAVVDDEALHRQVTHALRALRKLEGPVQHGCPTSRRELAALRKATRREAQEGVRDGTEGLPGGLQQLKECVRTLQQLTKKAKERRKKSAERNQQYAKEFGLAYQTLEDIPEKELAEFRRNAAGDHEKVVQNMQRQLGKIAKDLQAIGAPSFE